MVQILTANDDQVLLLHEQAIDNNSLGITRFKKFGDRAQRLCKEYQQFPHDSEG